MSAEHRHFTARGKEFVAARHDRQPAGWTYT
jgi:hypothetical protein